MSWEAFYLCCFLVGFILSLISFLAGSSHHIHAHVHLPKVNFGTLAAFLAWFGGTGYLLSRYSSIWSIIALSLALLAGLAGAALVFWFLVKVLLKHEKDLDPADYDMIGVLGRVTSTVRANGTGEMVFTQEGARRSSSARSDTGETIAKGVEVVVTRFEKGIAYVRPWDELSQSIPAGAPEH